MPSIAFDIIGTCFTYDAGLQALEQRLGEKLRGAGISPNIFYAAWRFLADRDANYIRSIDGKHVPFLKVLKYTFTQTLFQSDIQNAKSFAKEEDIDYIVSQYGKLQPREGMEEMFTILRQNGFTVWACSDADVNRLNDCFASTSITIPKDRIISADAMGRSKPDKVVYDSALRQMKDVVPNDVYIFAAAHAWDLAGARQSGFKTAYCTAYEGESVTELWGEMDIVAPTLKELAFALVEKYGS
ncbi:HAD-like protein [Meira miltonrushii]|uniref:HAD-like protein n=1 Tax=Meira miltonrushii TaxID=1280837 RepID=A0A316VPL1_9BASI|nr:HAD-like protein [Meira miltonrushii]PWN37425.1 HAD-like protein [Meira miltonrushii]